MKWCQVKTIGKEIWNFRPKMDQTIDEIIAEIREKQETDMDSVDAAIRQRGLEPVRELMETDVKEHRKLFCGKLTIKHVLKKQLKRLNQVEKATTSLYAQQREKNNKTEAKAIGKIARDVSFAAACLRNHIVRYEEDLAECREGLSKLATMRDRFWEWHVRQSRLECDECSRIIEEEF